MGEKTRHQRSTGQLQLITTPPRIDFGKAVRASAGRFFLGRTKLCVRARKNGDNDGSLGARAGDAFHLQAVEFGNGRGLGAGAKRDDFKPFAGRFGFEDDTGGRFGAP